MTRTLNLETIAEELRSLSHDEMLAYGLSCAERLFPNYLKFSRENNWGDSDALREALDSGWARLAQQESPTIDLELLQQRCAEAAPDTEAFEKFASPGLDSAAAAYHLVKFLRNRDPEEISTIAHLCFETVEMYLRNSLFEAEDIRSPEDLERFSRDLDGRVSSHPLMIRESARLKGDLDIVAQNLNLTSLRERWSEVPRSNLDMS